MDLARYIDHTALKANTTEGEIMTLCNEAKEYRFASVCVNPFWVKFASDKLKDVANASTAIRWGVCIAKIFC